MAAGIVQDAVKAQPCGSVPVVGGDVPEDADLAALGSCGHAAGGHCDRHAVAHAAIVLVDLRLEARDLRLEARGGARELTDRGSVGCAYSWRDIGDAPLAAGCADRHGVGRTRHRALPDRDRIGGGSLHHGAGAERRAVHTVALCPTATAFAVVALAELPTAVADDTLATP